MQGANERAKKQETKIPIHIIRCNKFDLVSVMSAPFAGKSARFCISLWVFFFVGLGVRRINLFAVFYSIIYWSIFSFSCFFLSFQSRFTSSSEMHSISCFQLLLLLNLGYKSILRIPTTLPAFFNLLQRIKPIFSHEFYTTLQSI